MSCYFTDCFFMRVQWDVLQQTNATTKYSTIQSNTTCLMFILLLINDTYLHQLPTFNTQTSGLQLPHSVFQEPIITPLQNNQ